MNGLETLLAGGGISHFIMLLVITSLACVKATTQSRVCRGHIRNSQDSVLYNAMFFCAVAVALSLFFPLAVPNTPIICLAFLHGVLNAAFQVLYSISLSIGPVSLTVLIINFSVLLPTCTSIFVFGESLYFTQLIGVCLLITSMLLSVNRSEGEQKTEKKWLILSVLSMLSTGCSGALQKMFYITKSSDIQNSENTFLVLTYIFAAVFAFSVYFFTAHTGKKEKSTFWFSGTVLLYAIAIGLIIAVFQKLFMLGTKHIDGTVFYPSYYGLQSVSMTFIGVLLFKDHLTARQKLGSLCGVLSIALMNLKAGISF